MLIKDNEDYNLLNQKYEIPGVEVKGVRLVKAGDPLNYNYFIDILNSSSHILDTPEILNNRGYYLEQVGAFSDAIFILEKVIEKFPNRIVAYINLGDAYWGLKNFPKAKDAYKTYVTLMKEDGKEAKIPQRVLDRIK